MRINVHANGFDLTPHTRGFYGRVDELYHLALATPPASRKPLVWRRRGTLWMIDWQKMRAARPAAPPPARPNT